MDADWIILADHAEILNDKLYLMGGGWQTLTVDALPTKVRCALAVSYAVPWPETNRRHNIELEMLDPDGAVLLTLDGVIETNRPAGTSLDHVQRVQMAVNLDLTIARLGSYAVVARTEGREMRRIDFTIVPGADLARELIEDSR